MYGSGISREGAIIDMGVLHNFIEKAGSWYSYNGERIGQGKENARTYLREHPEIAQDLDTRLREKLLPPKRGEAVKSEAAQA
jgi:recombination protein RecA